MSWQEYWKASVWCLVFCRAGLSRYIIKPQTKYQTRNTILNVIFGKNSLKALFGKFSQRPCEGVGRRFFDKRDTGFAGILSQKRKGQGDDIKNGTDSCCHMGLPPINRQSRGGGTSQRGPQG